MEFSLSVCAHVFIFLTYNFFKTIVEPSLPLPLSLSLSLHILTPKTAFDVQMVYA